jgi:hypothetical protein
MIEEIAPIGVIAMSSIMHTSTSKTVMSDDQTSSERRTDLALNAKTIARAFERYK